MKTYLLKILNSILIQIPVNLVCAFISNYLTKQQIYLVISICLIIVLIYIFTNKNIKQNTIHIHKNEIIKYKYSKTIYRDRNNKIEKVEERWELRKIKY